MDDKELIAWAKKQAEKVCRKFAKGQAVYFKDIKSLISGKEEEIEKGVFVNCYLMENGDVRIDCRMLPGVTLKEHIHPDYYEIFTVVKGSMTDLYTGITLSTKTEPYTFGLNVPHTPYSKYGCTLIIICKPINIDNETNL